MARNTSTIGLDIHGVRKQFGEILALDDCSVAVAPGQMMGFLGPNGAGKTTTMRAILGLVAVDAGSVTFDGEPISERHRSQIGYMPQERGMYVRMKVEEHVAYMGRLAGLEKGEASRRAGRWIERVGLAERRDDEIQELSVGNQQRVQLAIALVHEPTMLILDEPFAGLDPVAVDTLSSIMVERAEAGVGVLFSSHQLNLVQDLCEDVTVISSGRTVAAGTVTDLRAGSGTRQLEVIWAGDTPDWIPDGAAPMASPSGVSRFEMTADVDPRVLIAEAAAHGEVGSFAFAPPSLDEVFLELVSQ